MKPRRKDPNLKSFVTTTPPEGWKVGEIVERRTVKKNLLLMPSANKKLMAITKRYSLSQSTIINALIIRFGDELDRIDEYNRNLTDENFEN